MHSVVSRKATLKVTQLNNTLSQFAQPIMYNGDVNVVKDLYVGGNEQLNGNLTIGGNLVVNHLTVRKDETVNGRLFAIGDVSFNSNLFVNGNINVNQTILAKTFLPGQVINVSMFSNTQLGQNTLTVSPTITSDVFSISFTPKYSNSYLIIEYQTTYSLGGNGDDIAYTYLNVYDGTTFLRISQNYQKWVNSSGGGTRSGVLFPLIGRYTNTTTSAKTISVGLYNSASGDPITVDSDVSTWLKITEIGR
jgi:hypothetical protein